ncbi:S9 family peptidase [Cellvibrio japonicus]|nr:S9 family peptidase [Cellvibrio japonicus]
MNSQPDMTRPAIAYGHWPSPVTPELLTAGSIRLSEPQSCAGRIFWLESRPAEKGRTALVCEYRGERQDLLPAPHSVRTRAQEYGGGSYLATRTGIFCVLDVNQRIYFYSFAKGSLTPVSPEGPYRYADFCYDTKRRQLLVVREDYTADEQHPHSAIVALDLGTGQIHVRAEGADFYSNPRLSPDGSKLSYLRWNHPQMPWDGSECFCASLNAAGDIIGEVRVAGGNSESIFQPQWSPAGELYLVSDRSNWWNLYRWHEQRLEPLCAQPAEFATPQWVFGMSSYGFLSERIIFCTYSQGGQWHLGLVDSQSGELTRIQSPFRDISNIHCHNGEALFLAAGAAHPQQLYRCSQASFTSVTPASLPIPSTYLAQPQSVSYPTPDGQEAHGFFYPPTNPSVTPPANSKPPLLVMAHGGPTGACESSFNLKIQFWTSRGFAVLDVNYRGSTGYGRRYRDKLKGQWGVIDLIDVCSGVDYLASQGKVDPNKVAIRGSSAGGFTVLAALTFSDRFKVGASLYGIGDLEALARDTHKFEAHYLDSLVGEYPAQAARYRERSPIHHIDQLQCPVIFFQGLQDKVVPPIQAEAMVAALQAKGIKTRYISFEGEGHGFRQAANIQRALEEELKFYLDVFEG